jgi:hypothetical protein
MLSEGQKRRASLNVLEKLRAKGMPEREDNVEDMFAQVDAEGNVINGEEPDSMPAEKKKKKAYERGDGPIRKPAPNQEGAKQISDFFRK